MALRQTEAGTSEEDRRNLGIAESALFRWKRQFGGLGVGELSVLGQISRVRAASRWLPAAFSHRPGESRQPAVLLKQAAAMGGLLLLVRCGHNPEGPSGPPPVDAVTLTCPADVHVQNVSGATPVNFPAPGASGGVSPVSTTCAPGSGSLFPVGSTTVTCTGTDSAMPRTFRSLLFRRHAHARGSRAEGDDLSRARR